MNYLGNLCSIITEFNRLAKYYKEDLEGCWVLLYFIMSIDITVNIILPRCMLGLSGNLCS